jgi:hypothetical protein
LVTLADEPRETLRGSSRGLQLFRRRRDLALEISKNGFELGG